MNFGLYISTTFITFPSTRLLIGSEHSNHLCSSFAFALWLVMPNSLYASSIKAFALATEMESGVLMVFVIILANRYSIVLSLSRLIKAFSMDFFTNRKLFTFSVPNLWYASLTNGCSRSNTNSCGENRSSEIISAYCKNAY